MNPRIADNSSTEFIMSCFQSVSLHQTVVDKDIIPSWVCVRPLLSSAKVSEMHVGFLSFILKPVIEYFTGNTSILNFTKIAKQLDLVALPIFCDKGNFRILVIFTSKGKMNFRYLLKCYDSSRYELVKQEFGKFSNICSESDKFIERLCSSSQGRAKGKTVSTQYKDSFLFSVHQAA